MIDGTEAFRMACEHLAASVQLTPVAGPPSAVYLADDAAGLWFFRIERGELPVGGDEVIAVRERDGVVVGRAMVGA
jgi:hypothetical protein